MGRYCAECEEWLTNSNFSSNQWRKGEGCSRCKDCVSGYNNNNQQQQQQHFIGGGSFIRSESGIEQSLRRIHMTGFVQQIYQCGECHRNFNSQNELNMHMQVHRPRSVACPICGERKFRTGANAVQHVESGHCSGCSGRDNARRQIYEFAHRQPSMQGFMNGTPLLTNGGNNYGVPDHPYQCRECTKSFRQLSQLMQHQDQKHNNTRMRLGY